MPVWSDVERSKSQLVKGLHDWWQAARGGARMPDRSAVDPVALKPLLPNILISEAEPDPFRVRFRLVGTRVVEVTGFDITGCHLDTLLPAEPDQPWLEHYRAVYAGGRPLYGMTTVPTTAGGSYAYEFAIFPLTRGGNAVAQFIAVEDYFDFQLTVQQLKPWRQKP